MESMIRSLFFDGMFDGDAAISKALEAQQGKHSCLKDTSDLLLILADLQNQSVL